MKSLPKIFTLLLALSLLIACGSGAGHEVTKFTFDDHPDYRVQVNDKSVDDYYIYTVEVWKGVKQICKQSGVDTDAQGKLFAEPVDQEELAKFMLVNCINDQSSQVPLVSQPQPVAKSSVAPVKPKKKTKAKGNSQQLNQNVLNRISQIDQSLAQLQPYIAKNNELVTLKQNILLTTIEVMGYTVENGKIMKDGREYTVDENNIIKPK